MPDSILQLRGLHLRGTTGTDTAFIAWGYGNGIGSYLRGGQGNAWSHGLKIMADAVGAPAMHVASAAEGIEISAGDDGIYIAGSGSGYDINLAGANQVIQGAMYAVEYVSKCTTLVNKDGFSLASSQTFNNTGTWTGNLTGSVGSLGTQAKADVEAECGDALTAYDPPTRTEATSDKDAIITEVDANETKIDALDDNPWNNALTDTGSGMGDWFADWFNANYWLTASGFSTHGAADVAALWGDTLTYLIAFRDSVNNAIADANKLNFHSSGDTIGREASTFDPAADTVAYVDSLIEDLTLTSVDSVRKVYIVDSLDQTISAQADTEAIARYNWNYPVRTLTSGAGTGSNQVTIRLKSSTDSSAIPGATIAVWNSDQTALIGLLDSDTDSGKQTFALNNGTYNLRINKYKFQWTVPITIGVSGDKDTTIYATEFTPSPPPAPYLVTVYGYIDSVGLVGHRAKISCTIHAQELRYGSVILGYYSYTKTAYTNASGYWEMFVYANEDLTPPGSMYEFTIKTPYRPVFTKWVTVPTPGPWELTW